MTHAAGSDTCEVRRATIADVPAIVPMVGAYWEFEGIGGFDPPNVTRQLERVVDSCLGAAWIAIADGSPAGYLLAVYVFSLEHLGLTAEIDELFVSPWFRGRGVGGEILRAAEAEFVRIGCTNVSLQVAHGNDAARALYHRHGYSEREGYDLLDKMLRPV